MKWIKASERLPDRFYDRNYYIKLDNISPRLGIFTRRDLDEFDDKTKEPFLIVLTNGAAPEFEVSVDKFTGVQWLDESLSDQGDVWRNIQSDLEKVINHTPTGDGRNMLCDINIKMLSALQSSPLKGTEDKEVK